MIGSLPQGKVDNVGSYALCLNFDCHADIVLSLRPRLPERSHPAIMDENLDPRAIQEIEDELHTKIYPGTEIMKDVGSHHFVKAGEKIGKSRVLVPQPSNDPQDPLNWSPGWKLSAISCGCLLSFSLNLGPLANAPLFGRRHRTPILACQH